MSHVPETEVQKATERYFKELFPNATIKTGWDARLPNTGRFPDLIVEDSEFGNFVVEVENDFEAAIKGLGQALIYGRESGYAPVLVLPEGHTEEPEWTYMRTFVHGITIDVSSEAD